MLGAILFVIYGVLIHAYSNIILNGILICVQIAKLRRLAKGR
jgi:hypothetical protein